MNAFMRLALVAAALALFTAGPAHGAAAQRRKGEAAEAINTFAVDLYQLLAKEKGNVFFSPSSISTAFAMTYAGARGNTASEMATTLHFPADQALLHTSFKELLGGLKGGDQYELSSANALWGQKGYAFLPEFLRVTREEYGSEFREADFLGARREARDAINEWVSQATHGKIPELLGRGTPSRDTRLVLANAVYFHGSWVDAFKEEERRNEPFTLAGGEEVRVEMMHRTSNALYAEGSGFRALEMMYKGGSVSMLALLPVEADRFTEKETSLSSETLDKIVRNLRSQKVAVTMPRFEMSLGLDLADKMQSLGMKEAFSPRADFTGMEPKGELFIGFAVHKAFVEVNEEGTTAAAATGVGMSLSAAPRLAVFRADRP